MSLLAVITLGVAALAASETEIPDTFGQRGDWGVLLARQDVRGELKFGAEESKQADDLLAAHAAEEKTLRETAAKLFSAEQIQRLQQLGWQAAEGYALLDPLVAKELKFTSKQQVALEEAQAANAAKHAEMQDFLRRARFRSAEARDAYIEEYRAVASGRLLAVLTDEQDAKLAELAGKPFEFKKGE